MKHYYFDIADKKISIHNSEVHSVEDNFKAYESSFGSKMLYYKVVEGQVKEITGRLY